MFGLHALNRELEQLKDSVKHHFAIYLFLDFLIMSSKTEQNLLTWQMETHLLFQTDKNG